MPLVQVGVRVDDLRVLQHPLAEAVGHGSDGEDAAQTFIKSRLGHDSILLLGQFEIFERGRIAERNQDGAANLRRVGTVRSVRLDIPLRTWWI